MTKTTPPRRRWFQFSLATMFIVVTVVAVFIGYHVNWVRERRAALALTNSYRVYFKQYYVPTAAPARAPGLLSLFGESGHSDLLMFFGREPTEGYFYYNRELTPSEQSEVSRIKRLFPEARVETKAIVPDPPQYSSNRSQ